MEDFGEGRARGSKVGKEINIEVMSEMEEEGKRWNKWMVREKGGCMRGSKVG